ncbi:dienelactone hydrolase family protein [Ruania suaedae]|uniref:alpha/beta hydrolase n=1 Tax=Ruania suaedae TaxID=2897774 RepID=UPI001E3B9E0C|nr:dienelactone hydrolase family protein [Ruania suaedae]UFU04420.1 dienelactone hydrolase family protein [Ruania suaedae]
MASSARPTRLPIDDDAVRWHLPAPYSPQERAEAIDRRPLLVLLHGYGADEHDLAGLAPQVAPDAVVASVRAPLPAHPGYAWFPIEDIARAGSPDPGIAAAATAGVMRWLEGVQALARTPGPVGLLGFSQGGAMVTQLLRHHPELFACGVVLSGFLVPGLVAGDEALAQIRPPVFSGYGSADPLLPPEVFETTTAFLTAHTDLTVTRYPGLGHGVSPVEVAAVAEFLERHLRG